MFEVLKKLGNGDGARKRSQSEELTSLIATARDEKAALGLTLMRLQSQADRIVQAGCTIQQLGDAAARIESRLKELTAWLGHVERRTEELRNLDARLRALGEAVTRAETEAERLATAQIKLQKPKRTPRTSRRTTTKPRSTPVPPPLAS